MDATLANTARKLKRERASKLPAIVWMSDETRGDPRRVAATLPRGSAVLLRHYAVPDRSRLARALAVICRRRGLVLIIAADWRLAASVGADGCHLPEHAAKRGPAPGLRLWRRTGKRLITAAAHSRRALNRARVVGADAALLSPVFATRNYRPAALLGVTRTALWARAVNLPILALGGVNALTARALRAVSGIAGVGLGLAP
jgi:thiamine-phosphate pyrophosphorylase